MFYLGFCFTPTWPPESSFYKSQEIDCKPRIRLAFVSIFELDVTSFY